MRVPAGWGSQSGSRRMELPAMGWEDPMRAWWSSSIEEGSRRRGFLRRVRRMLGGSSSVKTDPSGVGVP